MTSPDLVLVVRCPSGAAEVFRFDAGEVVVGRRPDCALRLGDGSVSAVHLRFVRRGEGYAVIDPGSTHGTRLGDRPLAPGQPQPVRDGDVLGVGPYELEAFIDRGGATTRSAEIASAEIASVARPPPRAPPWTPLERGALAVAAVAVAVAAWAFLAG